MYVLATVLFALAIAQDGELSEGVNSQYLPRTVRTPMELTIPPFKEQPFPYRVTRAEDRRPISVTRLRHKVPKKAMAAYNRATAFAQEGRRADAVRELEEAVTIDPEFADAHNDLAVHYFLFQRVAEAETSIRRALDLDPSFVTAHINLAHLALKKGDWAVAEKEAQRAIALGDEDGDAQEVLVLAREARGR
jgi:Flp pilus assembly protein TadD